LLGWHPPARWGPNLRRHRALKRSVEQTDRHLTEGKHGLAHTLGE
jgi:hypothetical protein